MHHGSMPSSSNMSLNRYNIDLRRGRDNYWREQHINNNVINIYDDDDDDLRYNRDYNIYNNINNNSYSVNNVNNIVNIDDEPLPAPVAAAVAPVAAVAPAMSQKQCLVTLMGLVDDESDRLTDGTYLRIVNILKEMYQNQNEKK